jgi:hypothetical protein
MKPTATNNLVDLQAIRIVAVVVVARAEANQVAADAVAVAKAILKRVVNK